MDLNDPQERLEGFFPEYEHAPPSSFQQVLEFSGGIFVSTTSKWSVHAEQALEKRSDRPIMRWGPVALSTTQTIGPLKLVMTGTLSTS